jgi:hypothetical protein
VRRSEWRACAGVGGGRLEHATLPLQGTRTGPSTRRRRARRARASAPTATTASACTRSTTSGRPARCG